MRCPQCNTEMGKTRGRYQYRECGLDDVWLDNWMIYSCPDGHVNLPQLPDAHVVGGLIAKQLVRLEGSLPPDAILFLRKLLGLKAAELAHILGVNRVEVSRWENDHSPISFEPDFKLRLEVIDRVIREDQRDLRTEVALIFQRDRKPEPVKGAIYVPDPALAAV